MYTKKMTYTDYDGVERTEEFYFNLSKAELIEMQLTTEGGLAAMAKQIVDSKNSVEIYKLFKTIIRKAVGQKSPDGRKLMKGAQIADDFESTPAYSDLVEELFTNADFAAEFIKLIVPSDLAMQMQAEQEEEGNKRANEAAKKFEDGTAVKIR